MHDSGIFTSRIQKKVLSIKEAFIFGFGLLLRYVAFCCSVLSFIKYRFSGDYIYLYPKGNQRGLL